MSFFRYQDDSFGFNGAHVAQLVEHILGKDEVISSILIMGSRLFAEQTLTKNNDINTGDNNG